jgi:hypothetical protein
MESAVASFFLRITAIGSQHYRSVVSLAAYRAGERLQDRRLQETFNHSNRTDVVHKEILLPDTARAAGADWALQREELWNQAQSVERLRRARYAHEWMLALPHELHPEARLALARRYATALVNRYGSAVDLAVHTPRPESDPRNHHAHLLVSTRQVEGDGFGAKTDLNRQWEDLKAHGQPSTIKQWHGLRALWVEHANEALAAAGRDERLSLARKDEFGIAIPSKPGWSRKVEGLLRAGQPSFVADAELQRYAFELKRRALALQALEQEQTLTRLRAGAANALHTAPTTAPSVAAPRPADEDSPTDFAGWLQWRARQTLEAGAGAEAQARAALAAWQQQREQTPTQAGTEAPAPAPTAAADVGL